MIPFESMLMIGGFLMMLEPLLRAPAVASPAYIAVALREAFLPADPGAAFGTLLEKMP